jgi:predicted phage terminase large subunit-like protein
MSAPEPRRGRVSAEAEQGSASRCIVAKTPAAGTRKAAKPTPPREPAEAIREEADQVIDASLHADAASLCVAHPLAYAVALVPYLQAAAHVQLIAHYLLEVERGHITRLIIEAPPRHTKTLLTSTIFPAWYLGRHPNREVILATYGQERANDLGRALRDMISHETHRALFPLSTIRKDQGATKSFGLDAGGQAFAVGIGGPTTGRGAHLFIVDDPIKDRLEADSPRMRQRVVDWFSSVASTRLYPTGAIVLMATRWHEEDLSGYCLQNMADQGWVRLRLPAIAEDADDPLGRAPGEALWPERFSTDVLARMRGIMLPRDWAALYQQRPAPAEGGRFKRDWFRRHLSKPERLHVYMAVDWAVTPDGGDKTAIGVWGVDTHGGLYALDWWTGQVEPDASIEQFLSMAKRWKPLAAFMASGVLRRALSPAITRAMREQQAFVPISYLSEVADKVTRSTGFAARASAGLVSFPRGPAWAEEVISELCVFPGAKFDDSVDVCSLMGMALDAMVDAQRKREPASGPKPFTFDWATSGAAEEKPTPRTF